MRNTALAHTPKCTYCIVDAEIINRFSLLPVSVTSPLLNDLFFFFSSLSLILVLHTDPGSYLGDWASVLAGRRYTQTGNNKQPCTIRALWPPWPSACPPLSSPLLLWAVICEPAPPPPPFGRSLNFLFSFFLVEMSLGSCPPAPKKMLPALLLLSSVLLHCLIFHPPSHFVWNVLQQHHQLAPPLREDLDVTQCCYLQSGDETTKKSSQPGPDMLEQLEVHFTFIPDFTAWLIPLPSINQLKSEVFLEPFDSC